MCVFVDDFLFLSASSSAYFLTKNEFPKQYLSIFDKLKDVYEIHTLVWYNIFSVSM